MGILLKNSGFLEKELWDKKHTMFWMLIPARQRAQIRDVWIRNALLYGV